MASLYLKPAWSEPIAILKVVMWGELGNGCPQTPYDGCATSSSLTVSHKQTFCLSQMGSRNAAAPSAETRRSCRSGGEQALSWILQRAVRMDVVIERA